jgi:hypothetical protein
VPSSYLRYSAKVSFLVAALIAIAMRGHCEERDRTLHGRLNTAIVFQAMLRLRAKHAFKPLCVYVP